jgi:soluble lytic murein transglycosylase
MRNVFVAFLCLYCFGFQVQASEIKQCPKAAQALKSGDYQLAVDSANPTKCPTIHTLADWYLLKDGHPGVTFQDYQSFLQQHSSWPWLYQLRTFGEKALTPDQSLATIESYYQGKHPKTVHGLKIYVDKLLEQNHEAKATQLIRQTWHQLAMSPEKAKDFMQNFQAYLTQADCQKRADHFLIKPDFDQAETAIAYVTQNKNIYNARLQLLKKAENGHAIYQQLDPKQRVNPEVLLAYLKWLQVKEDPAAYAFFKKHKAVFMQYPERYWRVYNALARDALVAENFERVYEYLGDIDLSEGEGYADTQFLMGWVALRCLNDPKEAIEYFKPVYDQLKTGLSQSRFAYWLGRSYEEQGNKKQAAAWYRKAAHFSRTYYGQLAAEELGINPNLGHFKHLSFTPADQQAVDSHELVKAFRILCALKLDNEIPAFYVSIKNVCKTPGQKQYFLSLVSKIAPQYALDVARMFGYAFDFKEAYQQLPSNAIKGLPVDVTLVEAIIRKESGFNTLAVGLAKERGLMQIMLGTAEKVCKELKIPYKADSLFNPAYNVKLGSTYVLDVLEKYNGIKPIAITAYNAGPGRVSKWLKARGETSLSEIDPVDWVELIPFHTTRDYVMSVLSNEKVYKAMRGS